MGVQGDGEFIRGHARVRIEMSNLGPGMDTGVRAAAALETGTFAGHIQDTEYANDRFGGFTHSQSLLSLPVHPSGKTEGKERQ